MDGQIAADPRVMLELAYTIRENIRNIGAYNGALADSLNSLGADFHDEGYDIIRAHISRTINSIEQALPDFRVFLGTLIEIAELLKKSADALEEQGVHQGHAVPMSKHGLWKRLGAGVAAGAAAAAGVGMSIKPPENMSEYGVNNNSPAAHEVSPYEIKTPEQVAEEHGFTTKNIADLSENVHNIAEGLAEGTKRKNEAEEIKGLNNALREPEQGEYRDTEPEEYKETQ